MLNMSLPYGGAIFTGIFLGGLMLRREEINLKTKEALIISEQKYRVLFESFPLGIIISNKDGNIIETNYIVDETLGLSKEDQYNRSIKSSEWKFVNSDDKELEPSDYPTV